jgi:hypothetical protein
MAALLVPWYAHVLRKRASGKGSGLALGAGHASQTQAHQGLPAIAVTAAEPLLTPLTHHPSPLPQELWHRCAAVFDGGELNAGRSGSTVIDLTLLGRFSITRQGAGYAEVVRLLRDKYGLAYDQ